MSNLNYLANNGPKTVIDEEAIRLLNSNTEFNSIGVELLKESLFPLITISHIQRADETGSIVPFNHEEAALVGNLVRYCKLCSAFLEQFVKKRSETCLIFLRCITETFVNLKYFLKYKDESTLKHYIKQSLRQEKQFIDLVRRNIDNREHAEAIESRMLESLQRSFRTSDFEEDEINNSSKWNEKIKSRISEILGPDAYILLYGSSSHAIHGNWQDLITFHLSKSGDGFNINADWSAPSLQPLTAIVYLTCELIRDYATEVLPNDDTKIALLAFTDDLLARTLRLDEYHEIFIQTL